MSKSIHPHVCTHTDLTSTSVCNHGGPPRRVATSVSFPSSGVRIDGSIWIDIRVCDVDTQPANGRLGRLYTTSTQILSRALKPLPWFFKRGSLLANCNSRVIHTLFCTGYILNPRVYVPRPAKSNGERRQADASASVLLTEQSMLCTLTAGAARLARVQSQSIVVSRHSGEEYTRHARPAAARSRDISYNAIPICCCIHRPRDGRHLQDTQTPSRLDAWDTSHCADGVRVS